MANNHSQKSLYIGLMSGTSADGIDLALVSFTEQTNEIKHLASYYQAYDKKTRNNIVQLYNHSDNEIDAMGSLHIELAQQFATAINRFLSQENLSAKDIIAIGCHGQTIRHRPISNKQITNPFTLQIGCLQTLALLTNIRVVGDFRTKDIALGGQGAPLVPAFHQALFKNHEQDIFIVNIGGIANITYLPCNEQQAVLGFDTGPGNALLDYWYHQHNQGLFDDNGNWAKSGKYSPSLLKKMLSDPYFAESAPKSTGREYFNAQWLQQYIENKHHQPNEQIAPQDIQATLVYLTAFTIADAIKQLSTNAKVYLCGGGVLNTFLTTELKNHLHHYHVGNTDQLNISSQSLEAMAFAWLAYAYDHNITGNLPSVTGASKATVLGISTG